MRTFTGVTVGASCPFLGWQGSLPLLRVGQAASPLVGYLPLADPVHETARLLLRPLETWSVRPTAAQCVWLVPREFSPEYE